MATIFNPSRHINMADFLAFIRSTHSHALLQGEWVSVQDAANALHCSTTYIWRLYRQNRIHGVHIPCIGPCISLPSLQRFIDTRQPSS
jgi:hypothetical protein